MDYGLKARSLINAHGRDMNLIGGNLVLADISTSDVTLSTPGWIIITQNSTLKVQTLNGTDVTIPALPIGTEVKCLVKKLYADGSDATTALIVL